MRPTSSYNISDPGPSSLSLTRCVLLPPPMSPILGHPLYLSPAALYFLLQCLHSWVIFSISHQLSPTSYSNVSNPGPSFLSLTRCALLPPPMSRILGHPLYLSPAAPYFLLQCLGSLAILSISHQMRPTSYSNVSNPGPSSLSLPSCLYTLPGHRPPTTVLQRLLSWTILSISPKLPVHPTRT